MKIQIDELMHQSGVKFGTSGARGLVSAMSDPVCYAYTCGFLQYLEDAGSLRRAGESVALAGDLRPSTGRILGAVARAVVDRGYTPVYCGRIPSPAVALYGLERGCPSIMVTGSHIPADRNGIKFNKCSGEILKYDEEQIRRQIVELDETIFTEAGFALPEESIDARIGYVERYRRAFAPDCLRGLKLGIYLHSAVGRDLLVEIFSALGADVTPVGFSAVFVPVDTEAIRDEDVRLAREWANEQGFDAILSTDGDSDRPLVSDEHGEWLRGDVLGILAARYLEADSVSTPVSCNTALEKSGWFPEIRRTCIGSPYVVAALMEATFAGRKRGVGYEANGGFLTGSDLTLGKKTLRALPTRDAVLPILALLLLARRERQPVSAVQAMLPPRFTESGRIADFPVEQSAALLARFRSLAEVEAVFGAAFGAVESIDRTDGLRIVFVSGEIVHLRPSGNAPEFRCYLEADGAVRARAMRELVLELLRAMRA